MAQLDVIEGGAQRPAAKSKTTYFWLCASCLGIALIGFLPTYWIGMARGGFHAPAIVHIHAALLYGWLIFLTFQSWLVAQGRVLSHREWGLAGIALGTLVVVSGLLIAASAGARAIAAGFEPAARDFLFVPLVGIILFAGLFIAAILNIKKPETHKRLMLAATVSMLGAPVARWVLVLAAPDVPPGTVLGPPPVEITVLPALIGDLPLFAALFMDWRAKTPNKALLIAAALILAYELLAIPLSKTAAWDAIAGFYFSLAG